MNTKILCVGTGLLLSCLSLMAQVIAPSFSVERGYHDTAFDLELHTVTPSASIRYTLDGTEPTASYGTTYITGSPIPITETSCIRAIAYKSGEPSSAINTASFLFKEEILTRTGLRPGWPTDTNNYVDQLMYSWWPNTTGAIRDDMVSIYKDELKKGLGAIPTLSVVTDIDHLFDPNTGIMHKNNTTNSWERPCSIELIYPDGRATQINCGMRLHGAYSRSLPKKSLRFYFKSSYGASKLNFKVFEESNTPNRFDHLTLVGGANGRAAAYTEGGLANSETRDVLARRVQGAMNATPCHARYAHAYINGAYWGLYRIGEHIREEFSAHYLGCDEVDSTVIKHGDLLNKTAPAITNYYSEAQAGTLDAWDELILTSQTNPDTLQTFMQIQGKDISGNRDYAKPILIDIENYIDYLLIEFFWYHRDWPESKNWYIIRDASPNSTGFKFICWDLEVALGPFPFDDKNTNVSGGVALVYHHIRNNPEFKLLFADRVQKQMFNNGPLAPPNLRELHSHIQKTVKWPMLCELSRWYVNDLDGMLKYLHRFQAGTIDEAWQIWKENVNSMTKTFWHRSDFMIEHYKTLGFYPNTAPPILSQFGGITTTGTALSLSNTNGSGTIYYTLDGSDPRLPGGAVSGSAQTYNGTITLNETTSLITRVLDGTDWSAREEVVFTVGNAPSSLEVSELMIKPSSTNATEFIELHNSGSMALDLSGMSFTDGFSYIFPAGSKITAGGYLVLSRKLANYRATYSAEAFGKYAGNLSNSGETIALADALGRNVFKIKYSETDIPPIADGLGHSIVWDAGKWRASNAVNGSPDAADPNITRQQIQISEVLTHTDAPLVDAIELYNPNNSDVNLTGWFLSDDPDQPKKFTIPSGVTIQANDYIVLYELDAGNGNTPAPYFGGAFSLDSHGEQVFISSPDQKVVHGFKFGAAENGVSFATHTSSDGIAFVAQHTNSLGVANGIPRVGPVVINEIYYHPQGEGTDYIELLNTTSSPVELWDNSQNGDPANTWRVKGLNFTFPTNTTIAANGSVLITCTTNLTAFRAEHPVLPTTTPIFTCSGALNNDGETLTLSRPDTPDTDPATFEITIPWITVDKVSYNDAAPWPLEADGKGYALKRSNTATHGNDPLNWHLAPITGTVPGSRITASLDQLTVDVPFGKNLATQSFQVWNSGTGNLRYTIDGMDTAFNITAPLSANSSGVGDKQLHTLNFTTAGLEAGTYQQELIIHSPEAVNSPFRIPVTIRVIDPKLLVNWDFDTIEANDPSKVVDDTYWKNHGFSFSWPAPARSLGYQGSAVVVDANNPQRLTYLKRVRSNANLTISFYIKAEAHNGDIFSIIATDLPPNQNNGGKEVLNWKFENGNIAFSAKPGATINSTKGLIANQWQHFSCVVTGNTVTLYRDSVQIGSSSNMNLVDWSELIFSTTGTTTKRLLDNVIIYQKALTPAEITQQLTPLPKANAGIGDSLIDTDGNGSETLQLDASASTAAAGFKSYRWTTNGVQLATGATPSVTLPLGTHTIELTVTDNQNQTATDSVTLTVTTPVATGSGYDQWALQALQNEPLNNRLDDADGDGINNLVEYAFAMNPTVPNSAKVGTISMNAANTKAIYDYKTVQSDINYQLLYALDLPGGNWTKHEQPVKGNNGMTRKYFDFSKLPTGADKTLFLKIEISE